MKKDIQTYEDIIRLITRFYEISFQDERLGKIFKEISPLHLESHIPVVADFWEGVLLDGTKYRGNVTEKHFDVNRLTPLTKEDFDLWYGCWEQAVNELFEGEIAEKAKFRARSIADIMHYKMDYINQPR
ncbi:MAG TPA: group III truncated hemoglobin [Chitinophagales bacterium]|jgi:hemoglobin|nr:group III truncated hemoglobin [Chitinophagales bacterium]HPA34868.1 group III truncated hemoglobin [Chitinophagales bacterium]